MDPIIDDDTGDVPSFQEQAVNGAIGIMLDAITTSFNRALALSHGAISPADRALWDTEALTLEEWCSELRERYVAALDSYIFRMGNSDNEMIRYTWAKFAPVLHEAQANGRFIRMITDKVPGITDDMLEDLPEWMVDDDLYAQRLADEVNSRSDLAGTTLEEEPSESDSDDDAQANGD